MNLRNLFYVISVTAEDFTGNAIQITHSEPDKRKKIELIGSYTLDYEVSRNPFEMRKSSIFQFIHDNISGYVGIERDDIISATAKEIMATGVKEKDAFHVASAIYADCDYFISTDERLLKYKSDKIKLVTPIEFIMQTEVEE